MGGSGDGPVDLGRSEVWQCGHDRRHRRRRRAVKQLRWLDLYVNACGVIRPDVILKLLLRLKGLKRQ